MARLCAVWRRLVAEPGVLNAAAFFRDMPLASIASDKARTDYLGLRLPIRNAVAFLNKTPDLGRNVAVFSRPLVAGLRTDMLTPTWYNLGFENAVNRARTPGEFSALLRTRG